MSSSESPPPAPARRPIRQDGARAAQPPLPLPNEPIDASKSIALNARAYQLEMLEESLKGNIIVAMDTGSGKTQVAVLRIAKELERTSNDKIIWFLAPTVELCRQQRTVIQSQIQYVQVKILSSLEGVDTWSSQGVWDAVLLNVRVVVATYQVLLDAVEHAFVKLENIPLLVIDEAHNCKSNNPVARLMETCYREKKQVGLHVPHILGLTASPILRSRVEEILILEDTLDARCKTPHIHRDELSRYVNCPVLSHISYAPNTNSKFTRTLESMRCLQRGLVILKDPCIKRLQLDLSDRGREALKDAIMKADTPCQQTIKAICRKAYNIYDELGAWAADYFVSEVIRVSALSELVGEERQYLMDFLGQIEQPRTLDIRSYAGSCPNAISNKAEKLLRILDESDKNTIGIVFVKERAITIVLEHLLSAVPVLKDKFTVGSMVGLSSFDARLDVSELLRPRKSDSLHKFRSGKINLLVATSVLEEGIDVPACNLVICFDEPQNLKSFIQRRGRARMTKSRLVVMNNGASKRQWEELERQMKSAYQDEERKIQRFIEIENSEEANFPPFIIPSTGARLEIGQAISHLQHFCNRLSSHRYAAPRPEYICKDTGFSREDGTPIIKAIVELPIFVPQHLRIAQSSREWAAEKNAFKDAAFQAYVKLYQAGLVNDNLLPVDAFTVTGKIESRDSFALVREQYNPWLGLAQAWNQSLDVFNYPIRFKDGNRTTQTEFVMTLPTRIPKTAPIKLYLAHDMVFTYEIGSPDEIKQKSIISEDNTMELLSLAHPGRWKVDKRQTVVQFRSRNPLSVHQIGTLPFTPASHALQGSLETLIRDPQGLGYYYQNMIDSKPDRRQTRKRYYGFDDAPENVPYVVCKRFPKKIDLRRAPEQPSHTSSKKYPGAIALPHCKVDTVSSVYAKFGLSLPSVLRNIELWLVASQLADKLLGRVGIQDLSLLTTAICASSAREETNYQKLEFLGDTILKLLTCVNCAAEKLHFPEGFLSKMKDHFISNAHLCQATIGSGLDQFIITDALRRRKWRPLYVEDLLAAPPPDERNMSTKTLADVIESLIGASYLEGGFDKSLACIKTFLSSNKMEWRTPDSCRQILFDAAPEGMELPSDYQALERLLSYSFRKKSILIEATTHSSYPPRDSTSSLDRLEFIGDAILDSVIVKHLFKSTVGTNGEPIGLEKLHEMRTALVNADILGFLAMEWSVPEKKTVVLPLKKTKVGRSGSVELVEDPNEIVKESTEEKQLWKFLRIGSSEMVNAQRAMAERHRRIRGTILKVLKEGKRYPWHLFCVMQIQKFYSDIVEAVIGAVWVDSGSLDAVDQVVERLGLLNIMNRILRDEVNTMHPEVEVGILAKQKKVRYEVLMVCGNGSARAQSAATGEDGDSSEGSEYATVSEGNGDVMPVVDADENAEIDGATDLGSQELGNGPKKEYRCQLFVGDKCRVVVGGGVSREEVKVKAALEAVMHWDPKWTLDEDEEDHDEDEDELMSDCD